MACDVVPDKLVKVTVHGANIASTLYAVTTGGAPCDGLLFGETVTTTTQHLRDDDDMATVTESRAVISSVLCCAATCSFYDGAGDLQESTLDDLSQQQPGPVLGWLSYRPAGSAVGGAASLPLRPSMRESAVTAALLRRQLERHGGRQAALLLLVSSSSDHNGATVTWQYRCFQARMSASSGDLLLEPLPLQTLNLGGHVGHASYHELSSATALAATSAATSGGSTASSSGAAGGGPSGSSAWSSVAASLQHPVHITFSSTRAAGGAGAAPGSGRDTAAASSLVGSGGGGACAPQPLPGQDPAELGALAAGARAQVDAMKQHSEALLAGLHDLCGQAVAGEAAVAALRARRDALLAQLARSQ